MSLLEDLRARVGSVLELAESLSSVPHLVLVGGYAVSARTRPRFSIDIDVVVRSESRSQVDRTLRSLDFAPGRRFVDSEAERGEIAVRWSHHRSKATVDVMIGGIRDRGLGIWVPHEIVARGGTVEPLRNTMGLLLQPRMLVASAEVLVALKVQPLRDQDVADIVSLSTLVDVETCARTLVSMLGPGLGRARVRGLSRKLDEKRAVEGYSSVFSMKRSQAEKEVLRARRFAEALDSRLGPRAPSTGKSQEKRQRSDFRPVPITSTRAP